MGEKSLSKSMVDLPFQERHRSSREEDAISPDFAENGPAPLRQLPGRHLVFPQ